MTLAANAGVYRHGCGAFDVRALLTVLVCLSNRNSSTAQSAASPPASASALAEDVSLPRPKLELVAPPLVHPHEEAATGGPKNLRGVTRRRREAPGHRRRWDHAAGDDLQREDPRSRQYDEIEPARGANQNRVII
jgi:hypothetical protein